MHALKRKTSVMPCDAPEELRRAKYATSRVKCPEKRRADRAGDCTQQPQPLQLASRPAPTPPLGSSAETRHSDARAASWALATRRSESAPAPSAEIRSMLFATHRIQTSIR